MSIVRTHRSKPGERGNAIIEFAIGATVLVMVFTGVFQFGYAFYVYNNLLAAVDNGAKYAAMRTYDSNSATPSSAFLAAVMNMVVYGQSTTGVKPIAPGLQISNVSLAVTFDNTVPTSVQVSLNNYPLNAVFTTFTLSKPVVTYPYMGTYAP
jgi:Flp pilus assembly protein TadG